MRIVIDMQGAQSESRFRGIGRYTMAFVQAVVRNRGEHEVFLALNGLFPETIEPIREAFDGLLPRENIRVWNAPGPVAEINFENDLRRVQAEFLREAFLASLQADVIHICSLFEGFADDAVTSIGLFDTSTPVSVTLHDLIPYLNQEDYLKPDPRYEKYYLRKIDHLKKASRYLAISEFSKLEGIGVLAKAVDSFFNTSESADPHFQPRFYNKATIEQFQQKYGINRSFLLYTGGSDKRKNLRRLIEAYVALPISLRDAHQLVFAGKMPQGDVAELIKLASEAGLKKNELIFTGYVSDEELVLLYNICALFVFPSWHEGFGLPALEAMACGAPVIASNATSLPEVVGLADALFDPMSINAISKKMSQALQDNDFSNRLRKHSLKQSKKFSWDVVAKQAIEVWEAMLRKGSFNYFYATQAEASLFNHLANNISPDDLSMLRPLSESVALNQRNGIERQLFLDISELCQHDAATGVQRVVRSYLKRLLELPPLGFRVEPIYATRTEGYRYARHYTSKLLDLDDAVSPVDDHIRWQRGDVFFGLDLQHHVQLSQREFYQRLRREGVTVKFLLYDLLPIQLPEYFKDSNIRELHEQLLAMIATTDGSICISRSTSDAFLQWIADNDIKKSPNFQSSWVHIGADIENSSPTFGLPLDADFVLSNIQSRTSFLCVATLEPRKGQQQVLQAIELLWNQGMDANLILVGKQGWKVDSLVTNIQNHPEYCRRLIWLRDVSDEYLEKVYKASTCLIAASLNEGFGLPLIEAAWHGLPIIARDIPVFQEVAGEAAFYFHGDLPEDLASALQQWLCQHQQNIHPNSEGVQWLTWQESTEKLKLALFNQNYPRHQLLVDISELVQRDAKTGIQRVVRNVLLEWLRNPPSSYRVEPVYASLGDGYRYARRFTADFLGLSSHNLQDDWIDFGLGDVFFALDFQPQVQVEQADFYQKLRRQGVLVKFLLHDLLCINFPEYFIEGSFEGFSAWLDVVSECDGVICVSKNTANEFKLWLDKNKRERLQAIKIDWSHNGANIDHFSSGRGLLPSADEVQKKLIKDPSFLMVGTLEPRKGYEQVLEAFEQLWQEGVNVNLVIVGKQGWKVEKFVLKLQTHPELNMRLFWLEAISDEYLEKIYATCSCLIAASYGEGFGLPLIEAAQHKLPIFARDIPVFREVAEDCAYYFKADISEDLKNAVKDWLNLYNLDQHPKSKDMFWLTWAESAAQLLGKVLPSH